MISRKERIVSMAFLTTPLPENIDEDCEDCQHWIEDHTTIYESYTPDDIASRISDFAFTLDELWNTDKEIQVNCECDSCENINFLGVGEHQALQTCHTHKTEGEE